MDKEPVIVEFMNDDALMKRGIKVVDKRMKSQMRRVMTVFCVILGVLVFTTIVARPEGTLANPLFWLFVGTLLYAVGPVRRGLTFAYRKSIGRYAVQGLCQVAVYDTGLSITRRGAPYLNLSYKAFDRVEEDGEVLVLLDGAQPSLVLPRSAFTGNGYAEACIRVKQGVEMALAGGGVEMAPVEHPCLWRFRFKHDLPLTNELVSMTLKLPGSRVLQVLVYAAMMAVMICVLGGAVGAAFALQVILLVLGGIGGLVMAKLPVRKVKTKVAKGNVQQGRIGDTMVEVYEAGLRLCAPLQDSFWFWDELDEVQGNERLTVMSKQNLLYVLLPHYAALPEEMNAALQYISTQVAAANPKKR